MQIVSFGLLVVVSLVFVGCPEKAGPDPAVDGGPASSRPPASTDGSAPAKGAEPREPREPPAEKNGGW